MAGTAYIEGQWGSSDSFSDACQKLIRDLDEEVAQYGEAIVGDVEISEVEHQIMGKLIRIDAKTEAR
jgi:hypothetical protein